MSHTLANVPTTHKGGVDGEATPLLRAQLAAANRMMSMPDVGSPRSSPQLLLSHRVESPCTTPAENEKRCLSVNVVESRSADGQVKLSFMCALPTPIYAGLVWA